MTAVLLVTTTWSLPQSDANELSRNIEDLKAHRLTLTGYLNLVEAITERTRANKDEMFNGDIETTFNEVQKGIQETLEDLDDLLELGGEVEEMDESESVDGVTVRMINAASSEIFPGLSKLVVEHYLQRMKMLQKTINEGIMDDLEE